MESSHGPQFSAAILAYHEDFLEGAKAPDTEFKDFANHVYHVGDGGWGGAPAKAEAWYGHLVEALALGDMKTAAFAAGVLTHYATDVWMPLHTAQSEAEAEIHRAAEWSASRLFDALWPDARAHCDTLRASAREASTARLTHRLQGHAWVGALVVHGAETSNRHYERVMAHYDLTAGVVVPEDGYDETGRALVAEMLGGAAVTCALLFDGAIAEAKPEWPEAPTSAACVRAVLKLPLRWWQRRIEDAELRREVEAIYDELQATGRLLQALPEELQAVTAAKAASQSVGTVQARELPRAQRKEPSANKTAVEQKPAPAAPNADTTEGAPVLPAAVAPSTPAAAETEEETADAIAALSPRPAAASPGPRLSLDDDVEAAPSIGAKTAARLARAGITTVGDLLEIDPGALARQLDVGWMSAATIIDWQDQARLASSLPRLSQTAAKLLVGAGYRDLETIAATQAETIVTDLKSYAASPDARQILGAARAVPTEPLAARWVVAAQAAQAEAA